MPAILVIDDSFAVITALEVSFCLRELNTSQTDTPVSRLCARAREQVDLVVQDINLGADTTSGAKSASLLL